ncbi:hypothetical protein B0H16DRAFT_1711194 [Mycena metata]|uniref:Uncharacterized protein n=1 Tax=Mycena metata TaxID=1033252 RepID=A0AAD7K7J9_9AGAR|nr:hypothetical protein B0H16DRAFT_1711194 [Mycena metata]
MPSEIAPAARVKPKTGGESGISNSAQVPGARVIISSISHAILFYIVLTRWAGNVSSDSFFLDAPPSTSAGTKKRVKKTKTRDTAKKEEFARLRDKILDEGEVNSLDSLAKVFAELVVTMKGYKSSAPTLANWEALDAIAERLVNHHTFPRNGDDKEAFSAVVTRAVSAPVRELVARVESQAKAIISLTKTVESVKKASVLTDHSAHGTSPKSAKSFTDVTPKVASPIPHPSDEHILVRFDGEMPPLLHKEYHEILGVLNAHLASLNLPELVYTQKRPGSNSIFIVPRAKENIAVLTEHWDAWAPGVLPGGRIAPVVMYSYLQVNGVPFNAVDSLECTARSFEAENKQLGKVLSISWVNRPPSEAQVAARVARGQKPRILLISLSTLDAWFSQAKLLWYSVDFPTSEYTNAGNV